MEKRLTFARLVLAVFTITLLSFGPNAKAAHRTFMAPLTGGVDLFTDFPTCFGGVLGPIGLVADATSLYADDFCNQTTYRFPLSGGSALSPEASSPNGFDFGLTIQRGQYFGVIQGGHGLPAGVYHFDPVTLDRGEAVTTSLSSPRDLVADPISGDLYVSVVSDGIGIYRIQNPESPTPIVTAFAPGTSSGHMDGLAITSDGNRLYTAEVGSSSEGRIIGYDRSGNVIMSVAASGGPDGIAVARDHLVVDGNRRLEQRLREQQQRNDSAHRHKQRQRRLGCG